MFERGDLLLVPFPFSDLSTTKRRPVLALTALDEYGDFIALPVTSRPQAERGVPLSRFAQRCAPGAKLDKDRSHRDAKCQPRNQVGRQSIGGNRYDSSQEILRSNWLSEIMKRSRLRSAAPAPRCRLGAQCSRIPILRGCKMRRHAPCATTYTARCPCRRRSGSARRTRRQTCRAMTRH